MFYFWISTQKNEGQLKLIACICKKKSSLISSIRQQQLLAHLMFKGPKNIFYLQGVIFAAQISAQNKEGQSKAGLQSLSGTIIGWQQDSAQQQTAAQCDLIGNRAPHISPERYLKIAKQDEHCTNDQRKHL